MSARGRHSNLAGQAFGALTVAALARMTVKGQSVWVCTCECGATCEVRVDYLRSGRRTSCGHCVHSARARPPRHAQFADRFWARVDKNGPVPAHRPELGPCWIWTGPRRGKGYGHLDNEGAHRISWEFSHGPIDASDASACCVLHRCDTPLCVRADHLWLGSQLDNHRDMEAKGRHFVPVGRPVLGEEHGAAKLTEEAVRDIRAQRAAGAGYRGLAEKYGVSQDSVSEAARRVTWRHVE